jgi:cytoskeletal protein CcmA (bactofilin family)
MWEERKPANPVTRTPNTELPPAAPKSTAATGHIAVIGRNMVIIGKVQSSEDLYVDGEVRGTLDVENCRLTIGPNGKANAGAKAREVEVMGRIDGNVETVDKISIRRGGELVGDIKAAGIVIEDGAYFKGSIDIIRKVEAPVKETA